MAITLPIGIRVAAGLLGTAIDRISKLPEELPTLGVTLAGQLVKTSFRVRQELADLATRGDDLLSGIVGGAEENPPWATFDDDGDGDGDDDDDEDAGTAVAAPASAAAYHPTEVPAAQDISTGHPTVGVNPAESALIPADHTLTIAELKERLLAVDLPVVIALLAQEEAGRQRAAYLTLLSNRVTTLQHEHR